MSEYPPGRKKDKKTKEHKGHGGMDEVRDLLKRVSHSAETATSGAATSTESSGQVEAAEALNSAEKKTEAPPVTESAEKSKTVPDVLKEIYGNEVPAEVLEVYLKLPPKKKESYLEKKSKEEADKRRKLAAIEKVRKGAEAERLAEEATRNQTKNERRWNKLLRLILTDGGGVDILIGPDAVISPEERARAMELLSDPDVRKKLDASIGRIFPLSKGVEYHTQLGLLLKEAEPLSLDLSGPEPTPLDLDLSESAAEAGKNEYNAEVPVMITRKMHGDLESLGYSAESRQKLTPQDAWDILKSGRRFESMPQEADATAGQTMQETPRMVAGPEDAPEPIRAGEGTPKEWREKLRGLITGAKSMAEGASERFTKSKEFLNARAKEIDAQAQTSGGEKMVQRMGELYNKLNWREKLGIGLVFGASAVVSGGASIYLPYAFVGLLGVQRAFGMASLYLNQQKELQGAKVMESGQLISLKERAAISAVSSGALMGAAIGKTIEWANESGLVEQTREWLGGMLGHETPAAVSGGSDAVPSSSDYSSAATGAPQAAAGFQAEVHAVDNAISEPRTTGFQAEVRAVDNAIPEPRTTGFQAEVRHADAAVVAAETPSVGATSFEMPMVGASVRGYEGMMQDLMKQLPDTRPENIPDGSDLAKLYEAKASGDPREIGNAIHRIAMSHGAFAEHASALVNTDAHMSVNPETGNILFNGQEQIPAGTTMIAEHPVGAPTAPATETPIQAQGLGEEVRLEGTQAPAPVETAVRTPITPSAWQGPDGQVWRDSSGNPIQSESFVGQPAPAPEVSAPVEAPSPAAAESLPPQTVMPEYSKEFINPNQVVVDPLRGHVFGDSSNVAYAYGNNFADRLSAAQEFAKNNPEATIYVQAEKPVLQNGVWRPYVLEVKSVRGFFFGHSVQINGIDGPIDEGHIGAIDPQKFIKQLDK